MNHYKFFSNKKCELYPCHKDIEDINCLFCFCPLYNVECGGNYTILNGVKDCSKCIFPHKKENWHKIIDILNDKT
jgi:Zn-finger protein